jgi:hypothetical protein
MHRRTAGAVHEWLAGLSQKQELLVKAMQSENAGCAN